MPKYDEMTEEQQQAQDHPPSWAAIYGDRGMEVPTYDEGPSYHPEDKSSAVRIGRAVKSREQAAAERRDLAVIARAADDQNDDQALEKATELIRQGVKVPAGLRIRAARAAQRRGGAMPSSADQHAAKALRGHQERSRA